MRVLHLIKGLGRGGAEMLLSDMQRYSNPTRFTHAFGYFLPWKNSVVQDLEEQGAEVVCFEKTNVPQILLAAPRVASWARAWRADLIHSHLPISGIVARLAGRIAHIPVIYTEHNLIERYHPLTRKLNLATWRWQEHVIAVSAEVQQSIARAAPAQPPVTVVLNGIDTRRFAPDDTIANVRPGLGIPESAPVVGTVAVLRSTKKLDDWLRAAQVIRRHHPDTRFLIVGDGPLRADLEALAESLGLAPNVHFVGLHSDVRPFLVAMDVFMMSSEFEGLPLAMLEAMSLERAVVATSVGGIPEAITSGQNGLLVRAGSPETLAGAACELLRDRPRARRLGSAARETVKAEFSSTRMILELEELYARVANTRPRTN